MNGEALDAFLLRLKTTQGFPLSPLPFNIVLKVIVTAIRERKEYKIHRLETRNKTLYLQMIDGLCRKSQIIYKKKTSWTWKCSKTKGPKVNIQNQLLLYIPGMKNWNLKFKSTISNSTKEPPLRYNSNRYTIYTLNITKHWLKNQRRFK